MKIAVIGAGISGLTCAYELQKANHEVTVFEKERAVGGRMATRNENGLLFDVGANFFINNYKKIPEYLKELGVESAWQPLPFNRFDTFRNGKLFPIYSELSNLLFKMKQISFSSRVRLASMMFREYLRKNPPSFYNLSGSSNFDNETAYAYVKRLAGKEVADYIADPFCSTFQFHSCKDLSSAAALGLLGELVGHNDEFTMFHTVGGMSVLPEAMAKQLDVCLNTPINSVRATEMGVLLDEKEHYDVVVLASTANISEKLYTNPTPMQKELLQSIEYAPTINVSFKVPTAYTKEIAYVMVPFVEGGKISEYTNESWKGEKMQQDGHTLINTGLHEEFAKELMNQPDDEVKTRVKEAFIEVCPPLRSYIEEVQPYALQKWPQAIPKYKLGSITKVRDFLEQGQGEQKVYFCGDYLNSPWTEGSCQCGERVAKSILTTKG